MNLRTITSAALFVAACRPAEGPASVFSSDPHVTPIPLTRLSPDSIAFAQYSGVTQAQNFVIRDAAAWSDLWRQIHANLDSVPPTPNIDFMQEMIVAVALGSRNTGGYNVLLTQATEDAAGILVQAGETSPGSGCFTTQALTQPIDVARVARNDQPVRFLLTQDVVDCES